MKEIELVPNPSSLIEATRSIGYSIETSIADLLDNSITAQSKNIWISFESNINMPYISILDDGYGMNFEDLKRAMMYGSSDPVFTRSSKDLGRFGLGLKTASLSQCRELTVISKAQKNGQRGLKWDLDYLKSTGKWSVLELSSDEIDKKVNGTNFNELNSGTLVIWNNLDRLFEGNNSNAIEIMSKKLFETRQHLSLVFHRYIDGEGTNKVNIFMNNMIIESFDPFMGNKSTKMMDTERFLVKYINHESNLKEDYVMLTPYLLPYPSKFSAEEKRLYMENDGLKQGQGFYVYRNNRLIVWGTWFKMLKFDDTSKLARIKVDIPNTLDFIWSLDIKKSTAIPPHELKPAFKKIIDNITQRSKMKFTTRKSIETGSEYHHIWNQFKSNDGNEYRIDRSNPMILELLSRLDSKAKSNFEIILKNIENNIPLNSIFIDFSGDNYKFNRSEDYEEFYALAQKYLSMSKDENELNEAVQKLLKLDLFEGKESIIIDAKREIEICLEA